MQQSVYQVNHSYNKNYAGAQPSARPSFTQQINKMLQQWHSIKHCQHQCQRTQASNEAKHQQQIEHGQEIDFDQIMKQDLENQLQELQRQENEQYQLLENTLQERLYVEQYQETVQDFENEYRKLLGHIDALKQGTDSWHKQNSQFAPLKNSERRRKEREPVDRQATDDILDKNRVKILKLLHLLELYTAKMNGSVEKEKSRKKWWIF